MITESEYKYTRLSIMIYAQASFVQNGFTIVDTDDGRAWYKTVTGSRGTFYALVTNNEGNLPDFGDIFATIYKDDGTGAIGDSEAIWADSSDFAVDCLAELIPALANHAGGTL